MASSLHRRNPSHSDDEGSSASKEPSTRSRVNSTPVGPGRSPKESNVPASLRPPAFSTLGALHGHSRARSISANLHSPTLPSPLSFSFPDPQLATSATENSAKNARRHSRIHSRNLSVFFPRPGTLPDSSLTIAEDGAQEIEIRPDAQTKISSAPGMHRSRSDSPQTPFGAGFTFGSRPPGQTPTSISSTSSRRGHHHKHSLSHNFFSFLEPGSSVSGDSFPTEELHTQPTITPQSPWTPNSAVNSQPSPTSSQNGHVAEVKPTSAPIAAMILAFGQFVLGAWLWVSGQQIGSLACTGLGYWVVFDSLGVFVARILPWYLDSRRQPTSGNIDAIRRPYGRVLDNTVSTRLISFNSTARLQTVFVFSQAVYLLFSSVYICKETVEHLLLSASSEEGHHHHHGDEEIGIG